MNVYAFLLNIIAGGAMVAPANTVWAADEITAVSLDYCADQYLLALADKNQILALTNGSMGADSFYRDRAVDFQKFSATAPEVLALSPDIAVETWTANPALKSLSARVGTTVITTEYGTDFETLFKNLETIGAALGQDERARTMVNKGRHDLAWLKAQKSSALKVAYITPSGYTAGTDTVVNDIIKLVGFDSYAEHLGLAGWQPLPLETVVMTPPDVILTSFFDTITQTRSSWSLARHPEVNRMLSELPWVDLPGKYQACSGLFALEAAMKIRQLAEEKGLFSNEGSDHE